MTVEECTAILAPVALALRADVDAPTFRAYARALENVPAGLLEAAAGSLLQRADVKFFPTAPEWRGFCEQERRRLLALHAYDGCAECEGSKGWRAVQAERGPAVEKCPCRQRHADKLERLGLTTAPLAQLPAATEPEADYHDEPETFDALPVDVRGRLGSIASAHSLRRVK